MNFWNNKKILITGGAGLIGSALAIDLIHRGSVVTIVDDFSRGKEEHFAPVAEDVKVIRCDLRNYNRCLEVIRDVDIVVHMASRVGGIKVYLELPFSLMSDNVVMDTNVLRATIANGIKRLFYASSAHIYPISMQNTLEGQTITEEDAFPANPLLSYGWAKLVAEKQIESACIEDKNFHSAIARYIGIYGPNQDIGLQTGSVIPVFSHRAIQYPKLAFSIWGDGEETRSYCFIDDAVACTRMMIEEMEESQVVGPYNVGTEDKIKIKEIAQKIVAISQKDIEIEFEKDKKAKIMSQNCNCQKVYKEIGWKASTSFDNGLKIVYSDVERRLK